MKISFVRSTLAIGGFVCLSCAMQAATLYQPLDMGNNTISNLISPVANSAAATKAYVDAATNSVALTPGATGVRGYTGVQGATGTQGTAGSVGATGATGTQGTAGAVGATGVRGYTGVDGDTGTQGTAGTVGATGATGTQGTAGAVGATGVRGYTGVDGDTGVQGTIGATGVRGYTGIDGDTGVQGATGPVAGTSGQLIFNNGGTPAGTLVMYGSSTITNVPTPVNDDHVVNKGYVDAQMLQLQQLLVVNEMALISAGNFQMGSNSFADGYGNDPPAASPNHQVFISAFYMDKYEVTYSQWTIVRTWAANHGYTDLAAGSGKAGSHPIQTVNWYEMVKWCNARSEMLGLTPCYYTTVSQSTVYRTGSLNISNACVNWTVNGYRLPTEAEWEKAARGGAVGMRFPWADTNTITISRANYVGYPGTFAYDMGPSGNNPMFSYGGLPYTSPAGYFAPNGYGLYDMAGNVEERCWDWYNATYYTSSPASDPRGPETGSTRVCRGGAENYSANYSRVAYRDYSTPGVAVTSYGFRCVKGL